MPHFVKSHGLGNDYLVADPADLPFPLTPERIRLICDRHRGIGSDGILLAAAAGDESTFGLRIFNPDGSEAEKSGNGVRIFAKWLFDTGRARQRAFSLQTPGGQVHVEVEVHDGRATTVTANMGVPAFRDDLSRLTCGEEVLDVVALSVGNPHCVVLRESLEVTDLRRLGPCIERHEAFPDRTNVQLARVMARDRVEVLVWERGAGETLASGSSACAVAAACHRLGLIEPRVVVAMPGGDLEVRIERDGALWMRGPAEQVAEMTLSGELLARLAGLG